jgi:hypothetical protein
MSLRTASSTNAMGCNRMVYRQRDAHKRVLRASTMLLLLAARARLHFPARDTLLTTVSVRTPKLQPDYNT